MNGKKKRIVRTYKVEEDVYRKAAQRAIANNSTLAAKVSDFVKRYAEKDLQRQS